jgi:hypothetical protein
MLIKQMVIKYPAVRSAILEIDEDQAGNGFGNCSLLYRADINDPSLANAGETHCLFEILTTYHAFQGSQQLNFRLAKSILEDQALPNECLGRTPLQIVKSEIEKLD